MGPLRILVADDHEIVRRGLRTALEARPGWQVCAEACDGWEAVNKTLELKPDVVVLDLGMPNLNGLDAARQIVKAMPRAKVLIMSLHESEQMIAAVLEAGARGYLFKSDAMTDLIKAAETVMRGETFVTSRFAPSQRRCMPNNLREANKSLGIALTARERQVVQLIAEGKSTKEVAQALNISVKTAETHRSNLMRKLDLHSLAQLAQFAIRNGIIQAVGSLPPELPEAPLVAANPDLCPLTS